MRIGDFEKQGNMSRPKNCETELHDTSKIISTHFEWHTHESPGKLGWSLLYVSLPTR